MKSFTKGGFARERRWFCGLRQRDWTNFFVHLEWPKSVLRRSRPPAGEVDRVGWHWESDYKRRADGADPGGSGYGVGYRVVLHQSGYKSFSGTSLPRGIPLSQRDAGTSYVNISTDMDDCQDLGRDFEERQGEMANQAPTHSVDDHLGGLERMNCPRGSMR